MLALVAAIGCKKHDYPGNLSPIAVPGGGDTTGNNGGNNSNNGHGPLDTTVYHIVWSGTIPVNWGLDFPGLQLQAGFTDSSVVLGPGVPVSNNYTGHGIQNETIAIVAFRDSLTTDSLMNWASWYQFRYSLPQWRSATLWELSALSGYFLKNPQGFLTYQQTSIAFVDKIVRTEIANWLVGFGTIYTGQSFTLGESPMQTGSYLGIFGIFQPDQSDGGFHSTYSLIPIQSSHVVPTSPIAFEPWGGADRVAEARGYTVYFVFVLSNGG